MGLMDAVQASVTIGSKFCLCQYNCKMSYRNWQKTGDSFGAYLNDIELYVNQG